MKFHWAMIHGLCGAAFLIQLWSVLESFLSPYLTTTRQETKPLRDINFPLVFKVCVKPGFDTSALEEEGYEVTQGLGDFFRGKSRYNSSLYGWGGHTSSGGVRAGVREVLERVAPRNVHNVFGGVSIYSMTQEDIDISLDDHVKVQRVNFPDNCFTLDITNNSDVREKGIRQLYINFYNTKNSAVEVLVQGYSLVCDRIIKEHNFYSSGDQMTIDEFVGTTKRYIVDINEDIIMDGVSDECRNYPNSEFSSYR